MDDTGKTLTEMYEAMRARFGPQHWWPASAELAPHDRKLEICVGAILTQTTNWLNVEKALARLIAAGGMSVGEMARMPLARLAELIRPAGYYHVKARRLKHFIARIVEGYGGDMEAMLALPTARLRAELLAICGIGPETADSMVLYAAGRCTFVVDAYTRRIGLRHGLIAEADGYEAIKSLFESHVPRRARLYNDYHAQLVAVGKHFCRPRARCEGCPLERFAHDPTVLPHRPASR